MKEKLSMAEQVEALLIEAEEKGIKSNFFFVTTFKRYQVQMKILNELEKSINEEGTMVTKEYVKNRKNLYTNPAITEYNKTATAANGTVSTLINIVKSFSDETPGSSKLMDLIKSINEDDG